MRIITICFPEETPLQDVKTLIISGLEKAYEQPETSEIGFLGIQDLPTQSKNRKPMIKSKQQLFEEIFSTAYEQFQRKYKKCVTLENNKSPENKRFIPITMKLLKEDPDLLKTLIDTGFTLENEHASFVLSKLEEDGFGALPSILKVIRLAKDYEQNN